MSKPGAAIPDDVMRAAVRAVDDVLFGPMSNDLRNVEIRAALAAALPILTPAIERALIERMIPEVDGNIFSHHESESYERLHTGQDVIEWLCEYLPTEDEETK